MMPAKGTSELIAAACVLPKPSLEGVQLDAEPLFGNFDDDDDFVFIYHEEDVKETPELTTLAKEKLKESGFNLSKYSTLNEILRLEPEQYQPFAKLIRDFDFEQEKIVGCDFYLKFETMPYGMYKGKFFTIEHDYLRELAWLTKLNYLYQAHKKTKQAIKTLQLIIHSESKADEDKISILKKMIPNKEELDESDFATNVLTVEANEQDKEIESSLIVRP